jgi:uncharacterized membrane protein
MENLFSAELIGLYMIVVKFIVDMFPRATTSAKMCLSALVAEMIVFVTSTDVVAGLSGVSSNFGTLFVSGLTLSAVTSQFAHPLIERAKNIVRKGVTPNGSV